MHTGRLRTWNEEEGWGYIWSEVHNCDVFVDGADVLGDVGVGGVDIGAVLAAERPQPRARGPKILQPKWLHQLKDHDRDHDHDHDQDQDQDQEPQQKLEK